MWTKRGRQNAGVSLGSLGTSMSCDKSKWKIITNTGRTANDTNPIETNMWVIPGNKKPQGGVVPEGKEYK